MTKPSISFEYDVFISYRWVSPDQDWVRNDLVRALQAGGLRACLDVEDFIPGRDLILEMTRAGHSSRSVLCVISPDYLEGNRMVRFEALAARRADPSGLNSKLIPLLLRETVLPDWLRGLIPVNWTDHRIHAREWRKLLSALGAPNLDVAPPRALQDQDDPQGSSTAETDSLIAGLIFGLETCTGGSATPGGSARTLQMGAAAIRKLVACASSLRAAVASRTRVDYRSIFQIQECCGSLDALFESLEIDPKARQVLQRWAVTIRLHPATFVSIDRLLDSHWKLRKKESWAADWHWDAAEQFGVTIREIRSIEADLVRIAARFETHAAILAELSAKS